MNVLIDATDNAIKFAELMSQCYINIQATGFVADPERKEIKKVDLPEVDKTADVEKTEDEQDRPWETIEPDPIKVDEAPKEEPAKKYTTEEIRAAGAEYIKRKGKPAFKVLLTQYNINKLTELPEDKYSDFMEDCDNAR